MTVPKTLERLKAFQEFILASFWYVSKKCKSFSGLIGFLFTFFLGVVLSLVASQMVTTPTPTDLNKGSQGNSRLFHPLVACCIEGASPEEQYKEVM